MKHTTLIFVQAHVKAKCGHTYSQPMGVSHQLIADGKAFSLAVQNFAQETEERVAEFVCLKCQDEERK